MCAGDLILIERPVLSVSDDPAVCLACGVRHAPPAKCARFTSLFGPMRMALQAVPAIAAETDYPESRLLDVIKVRPSRRERRAEPSRAQPSPAEPSRPARRPLSGRHAARLPALHRPSILIPLLLLLLLLLL